MARLHSGVLVKFGTLEVLAWKREAQAIENSCDTGAVSGLMRTVKYTRDWKFRTRLQREEHSCFNVSGMITKAESETYPTYNFKTSADKQQFYN